MHKPGTLRKITLSKYRITRFRLRTVYWGLVLERNKCDQIEFLVLMHRTVLKLALIFQNEIQKRMNLSEIIAPKTFLLSQPSWIGHIISNSKSTGPSLYSAHTQLVDCPNYFSVYLDLDGTNIVVFPNAVFELAAFYMSVYLAPNVFVFFPKCTAIF